MTAMLPPPLVPQACKLRQHGEVPPMPVPATMVLDRLNFDWMDEALTIGRLRIMAWAWEERPAASVPTLDVSQVARVICFSQQRVRKLWDRLWTDWLLCSDQRLYHPWLAEQALLAWRRFNARRRLDISGAEWALLRIQVFRRDGFVCQYCDAKGGALECDHVVPLSVGGANLESNLVTACEQCNRRKRAMPVERFLAGQPERLANLLSRLQAVGGVA